MGGKLGEGLDDAEKRGRLKMVERFFSSEGGRSYQPEPESDPITLLSGPPSCGKTSLLFQYALNRATEHQGYVVFLCNRRRLDAKPPFLSQGIDPSYDLFHRLHFKYVNGEEDIKKYFAAFHLLDLFPVAVIIDDFGDMFDERRCEERYSNSNGRARDLAMVRVLALCQSAILHANKTTPCKLLLSDTHHGDTPRLWFIYKRWISSIFTIQVESTGSGSFLLENSISSKGNGTGKTSAKYSIALQYLVLEGFTQDP